MNKSIDIKLNCANCNKEIIRKTYEIRKAASVFCNRICHHAFQKTSGITTRTLRICLNCDKEFRRVSTKKSPNPRFCTIACHAVYKTKQPSRCHPPLVNYALGLCSSCYRVRRKGKLKEDDYIARRRNRLYKDYNITIEQWEKMYDRQHGQCAICLGILHKFHNPDGHRAAAVDHDHKTKRIRGLVCHICNRSRIGKNTVETAKRLVDFLETDFNGRSL